MNTARFLLKLQEIDQEFEATQSAIARLKARLGPSEELYQARRRAEEGEMRLAAGRKQQAALEHEAGGIAQKLAQSQERLYSGSVRNPKELKGLEEEVASLSRRHTALQDELLDAMVAVEEAKDEVDQARLHLAGVESQWESEQKQIEAELEHLSQREVRLTRDRRELEETLEPADLELYNDLRRRKGANPISPLKREACSACGVTLPVSTARQARASQEPVFCPSCGRLLVAP